MVIALAATTLLITPARAVTREAEPNGTSATANALSGVATGAKVRGNIFPGADVDFYSFTAAAGDRVYAATMTVWSAASDDSVLTLYASDGTTVIETDDQDGSLGLNASSIAGATLPAAGTYYLRVTGFTGATQVRPYDLYVRVQSGTPAAEVEPNGSSATAQALPAGGAGGWISASFSSTTDQDWYSISLAAGDTIFASLDQDPERDAVFPGAQLGIGVFDNSVLTVNDTSALTPPPSEAHFMTVQDAGTYFILVNGASAAGTYHLSVSIIPETPCSGTVTTYPSPDVPQIIPTGPGVVSSTITIPDSTRIGRIAVTIDLVHAALGDLDVRLTSPTGNQMVLFTDAFHGVANTGMNLPFDDEAAIPTSSFGVHKGMRCLTELSRRLDEWFGGEIASGIWTLTIHDDLAGNGGTLNNWSITICEAEAAPSCEADKEGAGITVFSTDFEAGAAGFTHSGAADEWERGNPTFAPVTSCNSGVNCWKTDLDNTYNFSSNQNLLSPRLDLAGLAGPIVVQWAQKYQMESASFDHAYVEVREAGGANPRKLWEWTGPTMIQSVGAGGAAATIEEAAGWQLMHADITEYAGAMIELRFHLDSDNVVNKAGLAIDDVSVTACAEAPDTCPADINGDGFIDVNDLLLLIGAWGSADPAADINDDGIVDVNDLLLLIGSWGHLPPGC